MEVLKCQAYLFALGYSMVTLSRTNQTAENWFGSRSARYGWGRSLDQLVTVLPAFARNGDEKKNRERAVWAVWNPPHDDFMDMALSFFSAGMGKANLKILKSFLLFTFPFLFMVFFLQISLHWGLGFFLQVLVQMQCCSFLHCTPQVQTVSCFCVAFLVLQSRGSHSYVGPAG